MYTVILCVSLLIVVSGNPVVRSKGMTQGPFAFLVPGINTWITNKAKIETVTYIVKFTFSKEEWDEKAKAINEKYKEFSTLPFFGTNSDLKDEFVSYTGPGFLHLKNVETTLKYLFKYKVPSAEFTPGSCVKELVTLDFDEIKRFLINLELRLKKITKTWTDSMIREDLLKQNTIMSWIGVFNEGCAEIEYLAQQASDALEQLNDNVFPAHLLGPDKVCSSSEISIEGEIFDIKECTGHKAGFSCNVQVLQPVHMMAITPMHKVAYQSLVLKGGQQNLPFARNTETMSLMLIDCEFTKLAHPVCSVSDFDTECKHALEGQKITLIIKNCDFIPELDPPVFVQLADGGVLLQNTQSIQANSVPITEPPPLILYSAGPITATSIKEEYVIHPSNLSLITSVVSSTLTPDHISDLIKEYDWDVFWANTDSEDYIDLGLIISQIFLIPFTLFGVFRKCKPIFPKRKTIKKHRKAIYRKNAVALEQ